MFLAAPGLSHPSSLLQETLLPPDPVIIAGVQKDAPFDQMTEDQWDRVIGINLRGQFLCTREAVRTFKRRGVREKVSCAAGKIICMSSVHDVIPWAGHVNYAASKGAILMMKSVAQEVAQYRTQVNGM